MYTSELKLGGEGSRTTPRQERPGQYLPISVRPKTQLADLAPSGGGLLVAMEAENRMMEAGRMEHVPKSDSHGDAQHL